MTTTLHIDPLTPTASAILELHLLSGRLKTLRDSLLASGDSESAELVREAGEKLFGAVTAFVRGKVQR